MRTRGTEDLNMSRSYPASRLGRGIGALVVLALATSCSTYNAKYPRSPSTAYIEPNSFLRH
jgi:hypothetical protein